MKIPNNKWGRMVEEYKFLKNKKYYKNNYWQHAHYQSSAVQGYAGGCNCCSKKFYNVSLLNKRHTLGNGKPWNNILHICNPCRKKIIEIIGEDFEHEYCG